MSQTQRESTAVESLDEMARAVAAVSGDLLASYERLEQRAGRMEEELERRVGELEAVLASLPTGVAVRDAEGAIVRSHSAFDDTSLRRRR